MTDNTSQIPAVNKGDLFKWLGAFALLAILTIGVSDSEKIGPVVSPLMWLAAGGATAYWWQPFVTNLGELRK